MVLFHGSDKIIDRPIFGLGKTYNDYGIGFYCTEDKQMAGEWAVLSERNGYINSYELNLENLSVLKLNSDNFTIINWLAILLENRTFDLQSDFGTEAKEYILNNFLPDYGKYDVITGYRADDKYFSFAQDFLNNNISVQTLEKAMKLGNLGEQIVLKSKTAFDLIEFVSAEFADCTEWYSKRQLRMEKAAQDYSKLRKEPWHKGKIYMMQILEEEIKTDDVRLR